MKKPERAHSALSPCGPAHKICAVLSDISSGKCTLIFFSLLAAAAAVFVCKACNYTGFDDESYYYFTAVSLVRGASFFGDVIDYTQLYAFVIYLPVKLFLAVNGSVDGIQLYLRFVFILTDAAAAVAVYFIFRQKKLFAAAAGLLVFCHVTYYLTAAPSYNTMGCFAGLLCCICLYMAGEVLMQKGPGRAFYVYGALCGFFYAAQVLCLPLTALMYFVWSICLPFIVLVRCIRSKRQPAAAAKEPIRQRCVFGSPRFWLCATAGIALPALAVVIVILSRTGPAAIVRLLPVFKVTVGFGLREGLIGKLRSLFNTLFDFYIREHLPALLFCLALPAAVLIDKKRRQRSTLYAALSLAAVAVCAVSVREFVDVEIILCGLSLSGLVMYALTPAPSRSGRAWLPVYGYSAAMSLLLILQSTSPVYSSLLPSVFTAVAAVFLIADRLGSLNIISAPAPPLPKKRARREKSTKGTAAFLTCAAALVLSLVPVIELGVFASYSYMKTVKGIDVSQQTQYRLTKGPLKGIRVCEGYGRYYETVLGDIEWFNANYEGRIMADVTHLAWADCAQKERGGLFFPFNTPGEIDEYYAPAMEYYAQYPQNYPAAFYVQKCSPFFHLYITYDDDSQLQPVIDALIQKYGGRIVHESEAGYVIATGPLSALPAG